MNIVYSATPDALHVKMAVGVAVESGLPAADLQFLDQPEPRKQFQVAIHGPQTDIWLTVADNLVQPSGSGVRGEILEFLQNHASLPGIAVIVEIFHGSIILPIIITVIFYWSRGLSFYSRLGFGMAIFRSMNVL
ncbi:MAG: hypothetical protein L6306_15015 [Planctomycetales bacterium]|nr:hypothetical protein [Planctomycetales bacterium]